MDIVRSDSRTPITPVFRSLMLNKINIKMSNLLT